MDYHYQQLGSGLPDRDGACFIGGMVWIRNGGCQEIAEHGRRLLERHAVQSEVCLSLAGIEAARGPGISRIHHEALMLS
jgi:hypothetical protein